MSDKRDEITPEQARAILEAEEMAKREAFASAYEALVQEYGYAHAAEPYIDGDGRIKVRFTIIRIRNE